MTNNLLTPILNTSTVSVNFFNGRLFSAEDINVEKKANFLAHSFLGQAIGSGVVYGFEVSESKVSSTVANPVLAIKQGLSINRNGVTLLLEKDTEVSLIRPATTPDTGGTTVKSFQACTPVQAGTYVAGAGVYLLLVCPASGSQGLAEVIGISTAAAPCNTKYKVDGVQFRLIQLDLSLAELGDVNHLQNLVAYKCFGVSDWAQTVTDPFGARTESFGLIDQLRAQQQITDCEVPLAVMYWTATGGLIWVDMWSVRRVIVPKSPTQTWTPFVSRRRYSEGLAMFLQFQQQIADLQSSLPQTQLVSSVATDYFRYVPAVGFLPISGAQFPAGFLYQQFFSNKTFRPPVFIEGAILDPLFNRSLTYPPIDLSNEEMLWLYKVRENLESIAPTVLNPPEAFMVFANGHISYQGDARYDLNYWDYANYD